MRSWMIRLSLLALLTGFTNPASAGTLNDLFTFQHLTYTLFPNSGSILGEGQGGKYLDMGALELLFQYSPDPEGGHPIARAFHVTGVIPELGILGPPTEVYQGVILADPVEFPDFLRFEIVTDVADPALGLGEGSPIFTWDVPLSSLAVPAPATGLLLLVCSVGLALGARLLGRRPA